MDKYDILIIGAATSGAYFAHNMAALGYSVKVLEKQPQEKLGKKYDIFHVRKADFRKHGLPTVNKGDEAWAFEFSDGYTAAPSGNYPKLAKDTVCGMHMDKYTARLVQWAEQSGALFEYSAEFRQFIFENGKIVGVEYENNNALQRAYAKIVVDCSGSKTNVRCSLSSDYGVENFTLTPDDVFYVVLKYVRLKNPADYLNGKSTGYPFFKTWIAPQEDPCGAIIGVGACHSYEYAEHVYDKFAQSVCLPAHEITHCERGITPYTRPPFSFVGDNFIVSGDAACLTKPLNGEGVTSSMVHLDICAKVLDNALKNGDTSRRSLWDINTIYNRGIGADAAWLRTMLIKIIHCVSQEEFEYVFKKDIVSGKLLSALTEDSEEKLKLGDILKSVCGLLSGIISGNITKKTIKTVKAGLKSANELKKLYQAFPGSPDGYKQWSESALEKWTAIGKMS